VNNFYKKKAKLKANEFRGSLDLVRAANINGASILKFLVLHYLNFSVAFVEL